MQALLALCVAMAWTGAGCAKRSQVSVSVDAVSKRVESELRTFVLRSGMNAVSEDDFEFRNFATYVENALLDRGFLRIEDEQAADLVVYMSYGVGVDAGAYARARPQIDVSGSVIRADPSGGTFANYFQFLRLDALDQRPPEEGGRRLVWKTTITSNFDSADLGSIFPLLVEAATPYLAGNTEQRVLVHLSEDDGRVRSLR